MGAASQMAASATPASATSSAALATLRAATASAHAALEKRLPFAQHGGSVAELWLYLRCLAPLLTSFEALVGGLVPVLQAHGLTWPSSLWQQQRLANLAALERRWRQAGAMAPAPEAGRPPLPMERGAAASAPSVSHAFGRSQATRLGLLYVLEGARLGNALVARQARQRLQLSRAELSYLTGASQPGRRWRRAQGLLTAELATGSAQQAASASARAAFAAVAAAVAPYFAGDAARPLRPR